MTQGPPDNPEHEENDLIKGSMELTELLSAANSGDNGARDAVYMRSYAELRSLATAYMNSVPLSDTLQPTALVNEAFARIAARHDLSPANSREFFGVLSRAMRDILVEQARRHGAEKRGGGWTRIAVPVDALPHNASRDISPVELARALDKLKDVDPALEELVRFRFFAGLSLRAVAKLSGVSLASVRQDWEFARAWLHKELAE